ncbi:MAG: NUDIX hydrolase [Bacteroidota bacterium]
MALIACRIIEVCVFRFVGNRPEYLLLKRASDEKIYPNLWQIVSGSIDDGEEAYKAALRELKEETNFIPSLFWVVPFVNLFYDHHYDAMNLSPFFAAQVSPDAEPVLSEEHQSYEWLPYDAAQSRLVWPGQRNGLDIVHKYIVGGEQAAGLTLITV